MVLDKKATLFERDENGELIPQEVSLEIDKDDEYQKEYDGETVVIVPLPRGKIKTLLSAMPEDKDGDDLDGKLILDHCVKPKYTEEEVKFLKPGLSSAIVNTIFRESGISVAKKGKKHAMLKAEDEFAKNSKGSNETDKKQI